MVKERDSQGAPALRSGGRREPSKAQLQRQMEDARESISQTVEEIKNTVEDQYESVKETVSGVLDYREQFQKDPIVWSVGALSAGFALGYTLGYAHKHMKPAGRKRSEVAAFADTLVDELSTVGNSLVMPSLNAKIKQLFGFDFSDMLEEIGGAKTHGRKKSSRKSAAKSQGARRRVRVPTVLLELRSTVANSVRAQSRTVVGIRESRSFGQAFERGDRVSERQDLEEELRPSKKTDVIFRRISGDTSSWFSSFVRVPRRNQTNFHADEFLAQQSRTANRLSLASFFSRGRVL